MKVMDVDARDDTDVVDGRTGGRVFELLDGCGEDNRSNDVISVIVLFEPTKMELLTNKIVKCL